MRLIDADAVIEKIHIHMKITEQQATGEIRDDEVQYMLMLHLAEKFIETVPSAELKQGWIPCSERLPERGCSCLVTDEERKNSYEFVLCDLTIDRKLGWSYEGRRIIAWMPLPKPYKEEEE